MKAPLSWINDYVNLADLSIEEALEVSAVHSLAGHSLNDGLIRRPPYSSPHHNASMAAMVPMRELLNQHADVMGASGQGIVSRIDSALDFADRMFATSPLYGQVNPQVAERIKKMKADIAECLPVARSDQTAPIRPKGSADMIVSGWM